MHNSSVVESNFIPSLCTEEAWTNYDIQTDYIILHEKTTKPLTDDRSLETATRCIQYNIHFSLKNYLIDRPWFTPPESIFIEPQIIPPHPVNQYMLPVAIIISRDICIKEYSFPLSQKNYKKPNNASPKKVLKAANDTGKVVFHQKGMGITALLCRKVYITENQ